MEQIEQYIAGERDYTKIKGATGPLVYPAAHVYIYWALYRITNNGTNILLAQCIFGLLYLGTLAIVMACYRRAKVRCSSAFLQYWLTTAFAFRRPLYTSFQCSSFQNGFIASSFSAFSMIASQSYSFGPQCTPSNVGCGHSGA